MTEVKPTEREALSRRNDNYLLPCVAGLGDLLYGINYSHLFCNSNPSFWPKQKGRL